MKIVFFIIKSLKVLLETLEQGLQTKQQILYNLISSEEGKKSKVSIEEFERLLDYKKKNIFELEDFINSVK